MKGWVIGSEDQQNWKQLQVKSGSKQGQMRSLDRGSKVNYEGSAGSHWGSPSRVITRNKGSINLRQPLAAILQCLGNIVRNFQRSLLIQQNIHFNPYTVSCVISADGLISLHEGRKSPGQEGKLFKYTRVNCCSGQTEDVLKTCLAPVVDDED